MNRAATKILTITATLAAGASVPTKHPTAKLLTALCFSNDDTGAHSTETG